MWVHLLAHKLISEAPDSARNLTCIPIVYAMPTLGCLKGISSLTCLLNKLFFCPLLFPVSLLQFSGWHHHSSSCPEQKLCFFPYLSCFYTSHLIQGNLYELYFKIYPNSNSSHNLHNYYPASKTLSPLFYTMAKSFPACIQALLPLRVHSPHITRMIFKNHKSGHILSCSNLSITFSLKPRVLTEACLVLHDLALASSSTTSPPWSPHQITAQTHQYFYCS